jgi:hypothetical protein
MHDVQLNAVGTRFVLALKNTRGEVVKGLSLATTLEFIFMRADGTKFTVGALLYSDGEDGKLKYTSVPGDVNQVGIWQLQAHVVKPGFDGYSKPVSFVVLGNL